MPPDLLHAFFARVARRLNALAALEGAVVGFLVASVLGMLGWPGRSSALTPFAAGLLAAAVGAFARAWVAARTRGSVARHVERAAPQSRNLLITAHELATATEAEATRAYVHTVVRARAASLAGTLDLTDLFPLGRRAAAVMAAAAIWLATISVATRGAMLGPMASPVPTIDYVDVTVTPPSYVGGRATTTHNPERIRAVAGSLVEFTMSTNAAAIAFDALDTLGRLTVQDGVARLALVVARDGFVSLAAVSAVAADSVALEGATRLMGISVDQDVPPTVRIAAPGRDLLVPDGRRALAVAIDAGDDIGLAALTLRYTRVSGSGERFTFTDAELPIAVARTTARAWRGTVRWALDSLKLEPGDMVVYRAVAADARPGAIPVESDAFIVEIAAPGGVAEAGYSLGPEDERYALSQQMVLLKSQRLLGGRARMDSTAYADSSLAIAVEQRRVRAEFVFLMGGEMSDGGANDTSMTEINEAEDAAGEDDLAAGRNLNRGRIALLRAIRAMSLAARSLNEADLTTAITYEREAIKELESAFSRTRLLLRAFSVREALDSTRRLTGDLSDLAHSPRPALQPDPSRRTGELRRLASAMATAESAAAHGGRSNTVRARDAAIHAEMVLRVDPAARELQAIAGHFAAAQAAWRRGQEGLAREALDRASTALAFEMGRTLSSSRSGTIRLDSRAARGAWIELQKARQR